jgi:tetratricopeptide (TPR) repeat protein
MKKYLLLVCLTIVSVIKGYTQENELSNKEKKEVLKMVSKHLVESYVDLEMANKMSKSLSLNKKNYFSISNSNEFSISLTKDLQKISKDLHLKVNFEPKRIAQSKNEIPKNILERRNKLMQKRLSEVNYGFLEVKVLSGNIGYINLRMFADLKYAKQTADAAMHFLQNTNAIIIDLRFNGGGVPNMMQYLASYFTNEDPLLLSEFFERKTKSTSKLYTLDAIDGIRRTNVPLYILTSKRTFSAAEAFSYSLKHYKKAIIVGEQSRGGANRTKRMSINENFTISVPYIKAIHPVTKTNWEGIGVAPTIKTTSKLAFATAYINSIEKTVKRNKKRLLNKIGYEFLKEKKIDNAIVVFKESTRLFPQDSNSWDSLGEAYLFNNDKQNALKAYKEALKLNPNSTVIKNNIQKISNE